MDALDDFASNLKRLRLEAGLTQDRLSERADLSYKQVQMYEQGRSRPKTLALTKLATALGVSPSLLMP